MYEVTGPGYQTAFSRVASPGAQVPTGGTTSFGHSLRKIGGGLSDGLPTNGRSTRPDATREVGDGAVAAAAGDLKLFLGRATTKNAGQTCPTTPLAKRALRSTSKPKHRATLGPSRYGGGKGVTGARPTAARAASPLRARSTATPRARSGPAQAPTRTGGRAARRPALRCVVASAR